MRFTIDPRPKARLAPTKPSRRTRRTRRSSVEAMEVRALLSGIPYMYSNSSSVVERGTAPVVMNFAVDLTSASTTPVTVNYQTSNGAGTAGVDYKATSGSLTFAPGQTAATIPVTVLPDRAATTNKSFSLNLSGAHGATLLSSKLTGTILEENTAPPPSLKISSQTLTVGTGGAPTTMTFTVSLDEALTTPVTVTATTSNLTAVAGVNYVAKSQVLTFAPGQTTAQFSVAILGSSKAATDYFLVTLSNASVAIGQSQGSGVIVY